MWWLSGIYREVFLMRKAELMIADYELRSTLTWNDVDEAQQATIDIEVLVENYKINSRRADYSFESADSDLASINGCAIRVELCTINSGAVEKEPIIVSTLTSTRGGELSGISGARASVDYNREVTDQYKCPGIFSLQLVVDKSNLSLWTPETPNLYLLVISLHTSLDEADAGVNCIDTEAHRFGIREVDIGGANNQLRLNRRAVTIAGVNRHEFHCDTGFAVDEKCMLDDAILMKRFNFNAVRCSHYPNHHRWLEICDQVGLLVVDEANIESHGFQTFGQAVGYLSSQKDWISAHMSRITRMLERDKNFTCLVIWSLGNESGVGTSHAKGYQWLKSRDPQRFVQYESGGGKSRVTDIICPMYLRPRFVYALICNVCSQN
jgi:beta-galactosidase